MVRGPDGKHSAPFQICDPEGQSITWDTASLSQGRVKGQGHWEGTLRAPFSMRFPLAWLGALESEGQSQPQALPKEELSFQAGKQE